MKPKAVANAEPPQLGEEEISNGPAKGTEKPLPLRALLTRPVVVSIGNYCMFGLLEIMSASLLPLVWSTSVEFGGLGMNPASIGFLIAGYGMMNGVCQFFAFPPIVGRFGPRCVFIASIFCFAPIFILFPLENLASRHSTGGLNLATALLIVLQFISTCCSCMGFGEIFRTEFLFTLGAVTEAVSVEGAAFMYISSAAPKGSIGATNGISQTMIAIQRTIGPATAASLFAFSLDNNILGGKFVYVVMLAIVCLGLCVAVQLPGNLWKDKE